MGHVVGHRIGTQKLNVSLLDFFLFLFFSNFSSIGYKNAIVMVSCIVNCKHLMNRSFDLLIILHHS